MHDRLRVVPLSARGYIVVEQKEYAGSRENRLTTRAAHHAAVKFPHRRRFPPFRATFTEPKERLVVVYVCTQ